MPMQLPKLAAPAQRALVSANIKCIEDLARFTEREVKSLHGIGPNALAALVECMANAGVSYKQG